MSNGTEFAGKFRAGARASPVVFFNLSFFLIKACPEKEGARQAGISFSAGRRFGEGE